MNMNKEKYQDLMLRFAREIHEVGVTENITKVVQDQYERIPNSSACSCEEVTRKFHYQHSGYLIEAVQTVKLTVRKCKS